MARIAVIDPKSATGEAKKLLDAVQTSLGAVPNFIRALANSPEALNAFLAKHAIKPVIDRVFPFAEAEAAYAWMDTGNHFGKVVIRL